MHENRLEGKAYKPGKRWDAIVDKVIWTVLAAVIAFVLAKVGVDRRDGFA